MPACDIFVRDGLVINTNTEKALIRDDGDHPGPPFHGLLTMGPQGPDGYLTVDRCLDCGWVRWKGDWLPPSF